MGGSKPQCLWQIYFLPRQLRRGAQLWQRRLGRRHLPLFPPSDAKCLRDAPVSSAWRTWLRQLAQGTLDGLHQGATGPISLAQCEALYFFLGRCPETYENLVAGGN